MSMPNVPDIDPKITLDRCKTIELLLSSIALEEISLSHLLNAEGEKLQLFLKTDPKCLKEFIAINDSVNKTLRSVVKSQILLHFKLEDVVALDREECRGKKPEGCKCSHCCKKKHPCKPPKKDCDSDLNKFTCEELAKKISRE
ncbi:hypothetical protein ACS127_01735 [Amphibacillus sp. Q70]|uniref:hypothetical protein n=1 Tax=Amphibacillus sp. Q70 TaxID=3453416 RepID=UPI003F876FFB